MKRLFPVIEQDYVYFATVIVVYDSGSDIDAMFCC